MAVKYASPRKWATNMSVDGPICQWTVQYVSVRSNMSVDGPICQWTVQYVSVRSNMSVDGPICQWTPFPGEASRLPGPPRVPRAATRRARRAGRPAAPAHRRGAEEPSACPGCPPALTGERCDRDSDHAVKRPSRAVKRPSRAVKRPSRAVKRPSRAVTLRTPPGPNTAAERRVSALAVPTRAQAAGDPQRHGQWTHARTHARTHAHTHTLTQNDRHLRA